MGKIKKGNSRIRQKLVYDHHRVCNSPYLHSREQRQPLEALLARGLLTRAQFEKGLNNRDLKILNSLWSQSVTVVLLSPQKQNNSCSLASKCHNNRRGRNNQTSSSSSPETCIILIYKKGVGVDWSWLCFKSVFVQQKNGPLGPVGRRGSGGAGANAPVAPCLPTGLDSRRVHQKGQSICFQFARVARLQLSPNLLSVLILTFPPSRLLWPMI